MTEEGYKNREVLRSRNSEKDFSLTSSEIFSIEEFGFIPIPIGETVRSIIREVTLTMKKRWMIPLIEKRLGAEYYCTEQCQDTPKSIFISMSLGLIEVVVFSDNTVLAKCEDMKGLENFGERQGDWIRFKVSR